MPWHVFSQIGATDQFVPEIPAGEPRLPIAIDKAGSPYQVAAHLVDKVLEAGLSPLSAAVDLLNVATAIFTADLRVWRGYETDQWTRGIILYVPVSDLDLWLSARETAVELASFLTGDNWDIQFRARPTMTPLPPAEDTIEHPRTVCLFSGGLDSYVGAIDLLSTGERIALVGHYGTKRDQDVAYKTLLHRHSEQLLPFWFYVLPPLIDDDHKGEATMRSRSILFLALGTIVASALGENARLVVPENGLISLNVPLTYGRGGSHSTRTTHPHTITLYRELLRILGIPVTLQLPYRLVTKGEMLRDIRNPDLLLTGIHHTISCAHPVYGRYRGLPTGHCGYCVPCIIRRAALYSVGLDDEPRHIDITDPSGVLSPAASADKKAFEMAIARLRAMTPFERASEVQNSGPIAPDDIEDAVRVYGRGMAEVERFLNSSTT